MTKRLTPAGVAEERPVTTRHPPCWPRLAQRNPITTYRMCGKTYTWDELREVSKAEAAHLPPETRRDGIFNSNDYLTESIQVGTIEDIDDEDDE